MTIVNDDSSIVIKWCFKLIDDTRGLIYDRHMFIVQATGFFQERKFVRGLPVGLPTFEIVAFYNRTQVESL